jgi:glycosyltransferase involved in cell wall biosynthesis
MALAVQGRNPDRGPRDPTGATAPRFHRFDELFSKRYDESILDAVRPGVFGRRIPPWARLAAEVYRRRDEYDVIVTWAERVSLSLMTLDRLSGAGKPHIAMLYWFSRPSVRVPLRAYGDALRAIVTWSSVQRKYAIDRLKMAPERIYLVKHFVDDLFWSPRVGERHDGEMICSAGAEMRDYPTLFQALRGTGIRCHVATDHVRVDWLGFGRRVSADTFAAAAGDNVTVGRLPLTDLRDTYSRSRVVVVPLRATDTDNGINVILEAMAMGKPVICSRTRGQVDVIQDGVTGLFVPVGDARALREAIVSLWSDPQRARAMGEAARAYVVKQHALDKFCRDVRAAIDASLEGRPAGTDGSVPPRHTNAAARQ